MKKTLIAAAVTSVLVSSSVLASSPFDGLYGGLSVGSLDTKSETKATSTYVDIEDGVDSSETLKGKQKANSENALGFIVGYGKTFDKFYLGGEFNYRSSLGNSKGDISSTTFNVNALPVEVDGDLDLDIETELGQSFMLSLMPGYVVMDNVLVYARLSYGLTEAKTTITLKEPGYERKLVSEYSGTSTTTGFGVGAEYAFTQNLSVRGEWLNLSSSSFEQSEIAYDSDYREGTKVETDKITTSGFELSLLYRF